MSTIDPVAPLAPVALPDPAEASGARLVARITANAVATLLLTSVHHAYGAYRYSTPWRLHVLLIAVPAIFVVLLSGRTLLRAPDGRAASWVFVLTTLVVPVLGIGAFEGFYNHLLKNGLFCLGAPAELMAHLFPPPTYEMPNDALFELTGIAQLIPATTTAWYLGQLASEYVFHAAPRAPSNVRPRSLRTISDRAVRVPALERMVHLQFRRFAGCPVCNLHLRAFVRRHLELHAANVQEVVVFHSSLDELRLHAAELPFAVVPDPDKVLYAEFRVQSSLRAVLDPRAWAAVLLGVTRSLSARIRSGESLPAILPRGGGLGLPADFLIATDGRVLASKYGAHADDQWSVDELLALVRGVSTNERQAGSAHDGAPRSGPFESS